MALYSANERLFLSSYHTKRSIVGSATDIVFGMPRDNLGALLLCCRAITLLSVLIAAVLVMSIVGMIGVPDYLLMLAAIAPILLGLIGVTKLTTAPQSIDVQGAQLTISQRSSSMAFEQMKVAAATCLLLGAGSLLRFVDDISDAVPVTIALSLFAFMLYQWSKQFWRVREIADLDFAP